MTLFITYSLFLSSPSTVTISSRSPSIVHFPRCSTYCVARISGVVRVQKQNQVQTAGSCERCERAFTELNFFISNRWTVERSQTTITNSASSPRRGRTTRFALPTAISHNHTYSPDTVGHHHCVSNQSLTRTSLSTLHIFLFPLCPATLPPVLSLSVIIPKSDKHVLKTHCPVDSTRTRTQPRKRRHTVIRYPHQTPLRFDHLLTLRLGP